MTVTMSTKSTITSLLNPSDTFVQRHIGPDAADIDDMLAVVGFDSLDALVDAAIPPSIRTDTPLDLGGARGEHELITELSGIAQKNKVLHLFQ